LTDLILDETDLRILNLLARDSRSSYSKIGKSIGLTTKSTKSRIDKMLKEKIIDRFVTLVSPNILDYSIICIFVIKKDKLNHDVFEKVTLVGDIMYQFSVLGGVEGFFIGIRISSEDKFMLLLDSLKSIVIGIMVQKCVKYKLNIRLTVMDWIIIKHLLQNPKIKTSEIGDKTTLSTKSIHRRLQMMQNSRLIQFTILPSPEAIKGQIVFYIEIKVNRRYYETVFESVFSKIHKYMISAAFPHHQNEIMGFILAREDNSKIESLRSEIESIVGVDRSNIYFPIKLEYNQESIIKAIERQILQLK
jgi:DNA-binding Lrp family transcriptional regulator